MVFISRNITDPLWDMRTSKVLIAPLPLFDSLDSTINIYKITKEFDGVGPKD